MVRFIQYNLLSHKLCDPGYFNECLPDACEPESRWLRIRTKLLKETQKGSILCLQEISQTWAGRLTTLFRSHGYSFDFRLYGRNFSDYMGVGIAFPQEYTLKECHLVRVGDLIPRPEKKKTTQVQQNDQSMGAWLWNNASYYSNRLTTKAIKWWFPEENDLWARARNKWNVMVMVSLTSLNTNARKDEFVVACYHMPCDFRFSTVMTLHSYYAMMEAQRFAQGRAGLVFCGDFNFKPDSKQYQMVTEGWKALDSDFQQNSKTAIRNWFDERGFQRMDSAYYSVSKKEPRFTNYAKSVRSTEVFEATLDYIFVSPNLSVKSVMKLPQERPVDIYSTPLPTAEEPSDHLMLGAEIEF